MPKFDFTFDDRREPVWGRCKDCGQDRTQREAMTMRGGLCEPCIVAQELDEQDAAVLQEAMLELATWSDEGRA